jgi:hypothetical protein
MRSFRADNARALAEVIVRSASAVDAYLDLAYAEVEAAGLLSGIPREQRSWG